MKAEDVPQIKEGDRVRVVLESRARQAGRGGVGMTITAEDALRGLRESVAALGEDYVYPQAECTYLKDGQPSCIVGHALVRLGVPLDEIATLDEGFSTYATAIPDYIPQVSASAAAIFRAAQEHQDDGGTWGYALQIAEHAYAEPEDYEDDFA